MSLSLVCPRTKISLDLLERNRAAALLPGGGPGALPPRAEAALLRADRKCLYPVVQGVPVLLAPEAVWLDDAAPPRADRAAPQFAEAYQEMAHYDAVAEREVQGIAGSESYRAIQPVLEAPAAARESFPEPREVWLDAWFDSTAQEQAYRHVAPVKGKRVLQVGGKGIHAVKFLLAGASEAWLVTPMHGEARLGQALAAAAGVRERFHCAVGVGEELPFAASSIDVVYSGGCLHHMLVDEVLPEWRRVLSPGGKMAAIDPWKAPLHSLGTRIFGKREPGVNCRPLDARRLATLGRVFPDSSIVQHGALTRYGLLALQKFGVEFSFSTLWNILRLDDCLCMRLGPIRKLGSSVAVLATKGSAGTEDRAGRAS
ncbi:MAG: methyltransferase domain-containing protein [Gemmataceae bacterium]|nr:methyltransferase domain-containing protein [Gemmataceae bacterium]